MVTVEEKYEKLTAEWGQTNFDLKMFTCYEQLQLSFFMYVKFVSPFDLEGWISITCGVILIFATLRIFERVLYPSSSDQSFSYFLFLCLMVVELISPIKRP